MRLFDELAWLWNDLRSRLSPSAWMWPLVAAATGAMLTLIATSSSSISTDSDPNATTSVDVQSACEDQTWPYLSEACLQRPGKKAARKAPPVRVLNYEPALADAAIGATPWAPKDTSAFRNGRGQSKQTTRKQAGQRGVHDEDSRRTVRSGRKSRDAAPDRATVAPGDSAYRSYGYVPR